MKTVTLAGIAVVAIVALAVLGTWRITSPVRLLARDAGGLRGQADVARAAQAV